jgi:drug/metabolite transporter (DMT)-like permease
LGGFAYNFFKDPGFWLRCDFYLAIGQAALPLLYGGLFSVGLAYTLQIHAQKHVPPAPAAILLCLEGVFALVGGWLLLKEALTSTILLGAALLLTAMVITIQKKKSVLH